MAATASATAQGRSRATKLPRTANASAPWWSRWRPRCWSTSELERPGWRATCAVCCVVRAADTARRRWSRCSPRSTPPTCGSWRAGPTKRRRPVVRTDRGPSPVTWLPRTEGSAVRLGRPGVEPAGAAIQHLPYREVWCLDFEYRAPDGERPEPHCMVARELKSGRELQWWRDELLPGRPPFRLDAGALFVAYYASAELNCFLALGWPMPLRILDLFAEFRATTNGIATPCGSGLLGAMVWHGLDGMAADEKDEMRRLAMRGGPYTAEERRALLAYCAADVDALARLLP